MNKADRAELFGRTWALLCPDLPQPVAEFRFCPGRRYRADWAFQTEKVLIEVDGGQWAPRGGRHNTDGDRWKLNEAARLGWRVLRFSPQMLETEPLRCCRQVAKTLGCALD